jgi:glycosyltransferase involved in cell wall biosynthesis
MSERVDVSVILLTYNHEPYIEQAIDSVLEQTTEAKVEILVSEDCSPDRTRAIVQRYARRYPDRIRLFLSEQNQNDIEVYLRAYRQARGDFVAYLDGDDYWLPEKLERQLEFLRSNPHVVMCYHAAKVIGDGTKECTRRYGEYDGLQQLLLQNPAPSGAVLFRRRALGDLPGWFADQDYIDWPLAVLLAQRGEIAYLDEPLSVYREHAGGLYSGASYRQQREWDLGFALRMREHLGDDYRRETALSAANFAFLFAQACHWQGDRRTAIRETLRSLRYLPTHPDLRARPRLQLLAQAVAPGAYAALRGLRDRVVGHPAGQTKGR